MLKKSRKTKFAGNIQKDAKPKADYMYVHHVITEVFQVISHNPKTSPRNMPIIPLLLENGKLKSDFKTKANYFNNFFASQYTPLLNSSKLPNKITQNTAAKITLINCDNSGFFKITRSLSVSKENGNDDISVRMIKICNDSLVQPLPLSFRSCIDTGVYPDTWKKSNIAPVHKKGDKQIVKNYRPDSFSVMRSKILKKQKILIQ